MKKASEIVEELSMGASDADLLIAAGFDSLQDIAGADAGQLQRELTKANRFLGICDNEPSLEQVTGWISRSRQCLHQTETDHEVVEVSASTRENEGGLEAAAVYFLNPEDLEEMGLGPWQFPAARLSNSRHESPVEPRQGLRNTLKRGARGAGINEEKLKRIGEDPSLEKKAQRSLPAANSKIKVAPKPETNLGRDGKSRWYIRGVLYPEGFSLWMAAFVVLMCVSLIPLSLVATYFLVFEELAGKIFLLLVPASLLIFGAYYLGFATKKKCRVCSQRFFVPKSCLKNKKAHRLPLLGYVISVALHMLIFRWFRCAYCGTSIRLKE